MVGDMNLLWKIVLTLAVVLPVGGYVAGTMAATTDPDPAPRDTIVINEVDSTPTARNHGTERGARGRDDEDPEDAESPDDDVEVARIEPDDLDDDAEDAAEDAAERREDAADDRRDDRHDDGLDDRLDGRDGDDSGPGSDDSGSDSDDSGSDHGGDDHSGRG